MSDQIVAELKAQKGLLIDISQKLQMMLATGPGPNYRRPFAAYNEIGHVEKCWLTDIGAHVIARDNHGPTILLWGGHQWKRRTAAGKFGKAIWFSRATGKNGDDTKYTRLITFKDIDPAEPMHADVVSAIEPTEDDDDPPGTLLIAPDADALDIQDTSTDDTDTHPFDNTPTAFWKLAVALQEAGNCSQAECEKINHVTNGSWLEKIESLVTQHGPIPEGYTP